MWGAAFRASGHSGEVVRGISLRELVLALASRDVGFTLRRRLRRRREQPVLDEAPSRACKDLETAAVADLFAELEHGEGLGHQEQR